MNIFENFENLNVSEECFDEIIESITKMVAPILAGKDKHGREESIGTKIDRASHKHPYIMKASSAVDNAINKVRNIGQQKDNRTPEEKLKNVKPAGTIYGKDMYSKAQLKDAAYKMSESLYNEIMEIVEEYINETIYDAIDKKYGKGENKALRKKAIANAKKEFSAAFDRDTQGKKGEEGVNKAMEVNRAHKRLGNGPSVHLEQERQLEKTPSKPVTNEIGKTIVKGNNEFDKAYKEALSAARLARKADKKAEGAFDDRGYMTDKFNDSKDADQAWDTAQALNDKKRAAMGKLSDVNKKQIENAKYAKQVKHIGWVPNKTGSGKHGDVKVSESLYNEIMDMVETLVGKYKEEGKPATSYSAHHGRNISSTDIKDEMKGELYPKQSSKYLDKALKAQGEESRLIQKAHDLDDVESLRKITKAGNDREHNKQLADMYMRKAYATGKVTGEAEDNYNNKRQQIK